MRLRSRVEHAGALPEAYSEAKSVTTFQDDLFSSARMVERTLLSGTVLRLLLEPLPDGRVRVLEYHRRAPGERWQRLREEEGRTLRYEQLKLNYAFVEVFSPHMLV